MERGNIAIDIQCGASIGIKNYQKNSSSSNFNNIENSHSKKLFQIQCFAYMQNVSCIG